MCKNVSVCVRRPSGNRRASAFSYKSYSLLLWSSRVSQTCSGAGLLGFHMGHTARIHEHTRADTGSDSQRPGQICSFSPWRQRERSRVLCGDLQTQVWVLKERDVFRNTLLSSFTRSHDLLSSEEDKRKCQGECLRSCFSWVDGDIKLQQTKKKA